MWSAIGALGGSAVGSVGSLGSSALGWYFSKKAAKLNYKYQEKLAKNRPSWNVAGLEKAGLNPMLASGGSAGAGSGAGLNVSAPLGADVGGAALAGVAGAAGIASAFAQKDKTEAETKLTETNEKGQKIENSNKEKIGKFIEAQTLKEQAQTRFLENSANKVFNEDYGIQMDNIIKSIKSAGYQDFIKENPAAIKEALAGEYGAKAKELAKQVSEIAKNWGSTASSAADVLPTKALGKLIGQLVSAIGKGKSK